MSEHNMTLIEFKEYCLKYSKQIYIRAKVDGKWGSYNLDEVHPLEKVQFIAQCWKDNRMPTRMKTDEELDHE